MAGGARSLKATWLAARATAPLSRRLSGRFVSRLWFTPWDIPVSDRARAKQAAWLQATDPISFVVNRGLIGGFIAGRGPTVLLVHGWGERAASLGAFVGPLVDAGYRVVGVDLPGHGDAPRTRTNIFEAATALRDVADQLGGIDAVIAHSMGAYTTSVAIHEGLDVRAAILLAPATNVRSAMDKLEVMFKLPSRAMDGLRDDVERRWGPDVWARLDVHSLANAFDVPALIVHDTDDPQVDLADSEALASAWPNATLETTTGMGHDKLTRDAGVIDRARSFLSKTISPRSRAIGGRDGNQSQHSRV